KINALQTKTQIITKNHKPKADNNETTKMLIEKVSAMLDKGQFDDSLVKMCMEALNSTQFQAQASQLKKSIDDFDYEKALSIVTHIKKSFS
ncbi:MAG: hypothetical protein MI802_07430, partial [Desulfobacterales bacterium]|nr:hypothetical protein [Desulfobacterales bacterium]